MGSHVRLRPPPFTFYTLSAYHHTQASLSKEQVTSNMVPKPPPAKGASKRMQEAMEVLRQDEEFNERVQKPSTEAMFFDPGAPGTVDKRRRARANFKYFCEVCYKEENEVDMYAAETLTDRVCRFLEGMLRASKGMLQDKMQMNTLTQMRQALEWWIKVFTPTFSTFRTEFHTRVSRHIRLIAVEQELSIEHRQKNNLGTLELQMFYDQIKLENRGLDNLKQHYVAWVLAFITGASTCTCYKEETKRFSASSSAALQSTKARDNKGCSFQYYCRLLYNLSMHMPLLLHSL